MICWSCQRRAGQGPLCEECGAIQPAPAQADLFEVLGLARTYFLEAPRVEERFKELNKKLHPDRFAQKSPRERRLSLEWTTLVNDAARTLRDPLQRALYLVRLGGIDVEKESGAGSSRRLPVEFLEESLEQREALEGAKAAGDLEQVRALARVIQTRSARVLEELAAALRELESTRAQAALEKAAGALAVLKVHHRFQEEVEAIEMAALQ